VRTDFSGSVLSMGTYRQQQAQELRRRSVEMYLAAAHRWIDLGLAGAVPLETAACSADHALSLAVREVMTSAVTI